MLKEVYLYTDGSCLGNPGPGGYGVVLKYKAFTKELSRGYKHTTNNRMEIMAVIAGLSVLTEKCHVHITTDSQYVKNAMTSWISGWKSKGWMSSSQNAVKNVDLWQQLDRLCNDHEVTWHWVKGHAGHTENEKCDLLARKAAEQDKSLLIDIDSAP